VTVADLKAILSSQVLKGEDRRRSQRVMIRIPVMIEFGPEGKKIEIEGSTASVNDHGAMLLCSRTMAMETPLEIIIERTKQRQLCRIVRAPIESKDGYLIPVEFVGLAPGFWGISFPPTNWKAPED
jgi:hypothetical protein